MNPLTFTEIYKKHYHVVFYHVMRKVNLIKEVAEEITNDVFISANAAEFDKSKAKITTWLINIANNKVIDYYRSKSKKKEELINSTDNENSYYQFSNDITNHDILENKELINSIVEAFNELSETYKDVATLFFLEQKKLNEIAELLNIPLSTVKIKIFRARQLLQQKLQKVLNTNLKQLDVKI